LESQIISNWSLKDSVLAQYENEDFDNDAEKKEYLWLELICQCLDSGFLVIYEVPVPCNVRKENGIVDGYTFSWGYTQTHYIHLIDITQLSSVLSNLDDYVVEEIYKEEQERRGNK